MLLPSNNSNIIRSEKKSHSGIQFSLTKQSIKSKVKGRLQLGKRHIPPPPPPPHPVLTHVIANQLSFGNNLGKENNKKLKSNLEKQREMLKEAVLNGVDMNTLISQYNHQRHNSYPKLKLSRILEQHPSNFNKNKISCVGKYVTSLDAIPDLYYNADTVYLSNNNLTSLDGMRQFRRIKVLSLQDNLISDIMELKKLEHLSVSLRSLNVIGNPFANRPNLRAHILSYLPNLRTLNNIEVTFEEVSQVHNVLKKEELMLHQLFTSYCDIHKLKMCVNILKIHYELKCVLFGRISSLNSILPTSSDFDLIKMLQIWDYSGGLTEGAKGYIHNVLRNLLFQGWASLCNGNENMSQPLQSKLWKSAASEVILAQQNAIIILTGVISDLCEKRDAFDHSVIHNDPHGLIRSLREYSIENKSKSHYKAPKKRIKVVKSNISGSHAGNSFKKYHKQGLKRKDCNEISDSELYHSKLVNDLKISDLAIHSDNIVTDKATTDVSKFEKSFSSLVHSDNESILSLSLHHDNVNIFDELLGGIPSNSIATTATRSNRCNNNIDNNIGVYHESETGSEMNGKDISFLHEQVKKLANDLRSRIHSEKKLRDMNIALRNRLRVFHEQNIDNVQIAEREIQRLRLLLQTNEEMSEKTKHDLQTTQQEREFIQKKLDLASGDAFDRLSLEAELEGMKSQLVLLKRTLDSEKQGRDETSVILQSMAEQFIKRRYFIAMKRAVPVLRNETASYMKAAIFHEISQKRIVLRRLKRFLKLKEEIRLMNISVSQFIDKRMCKQIFYTWRLVLVNAKKNERRMIQRAVYTCMKNRMIDTFRLWREFTFEIKRDREALELSQLHDMTWKLKSVFQALIHNVKSRKTYRSTVIMSNKLKCCRCIRLWKSEIRNKKTAQIVKETSLHHYQYALLGKCLKLWFLECKHSIHRRLNEQQATQHYNYNLVLKIFIVWDNAIREIQNEKQSNEHERKLTKRRMLKLWIRFTKNRYNTRIILQKLFFITRSHQMNELGQSFGLWKEVYHKDRISKRFIEKRIINERHKTMHDVLKQWIRWCSHSSIARSKNLQASLNQVKLHLEHECNEKKVKLAKYLKIEEDLIYTKEEVETYKVSLMELKSSSYIAETQSKKQTLIITSLRNEIVTNLEKMISEKQELNENIIQCNELLECKDKEAATLKAEVNQSNLRIINLENQLSSMSSLMIVKEEELNVLESNLKRTVMEEEKKLEQALLVSEKYRQLLRHQTETLKEIPTVVMDSKQAQLYQKFNNMEDEEESNQLENQKLENEIKSLRETNAAIILKNQTTSSALHECKLLVKEKNENISKLEKELRKCHVLLRTRNHLTMMATTKCDKENISMNTLVGYRDEGSSSSSSSSNSSCNISGSSPDTNISATDIKHSDIASTIMSSSTSNDSTISKNLNRSSRFELYELAVEAETILPRYGNTSSITASSSSTKTADNAVFNRHSKISSGILCENIKPIPLDSITAKTDLLVEASITSSQLLAKEMELDEKEKQFQHEVTMMLKQKI